MLLFAALLEEVAEQMTLMVKYICMFGNKSVP